MEQYKIARSKILERSCGKPGKDWIQIAPVLNGLERLQAWFHGHAYNWHRHDTYAIGVTLQGVQTFDYRGTAYHSLPGQVIVLHPDEPHNGRAGSRAGFGYRMIYLEPSQLREALDRPNLPFVPDTVFDDAVLARTILAAFESFPQRLAELESDALVTRIADRLERRSDAGRSASKLTVPLKIMDRVRALLDEDFKRPVPSKELETLTGLTRYAIARFFRVCYGTSPYRYLLMRRLAEARRRIVAGAPIVRTAIELGFADQSHLTRCFHQMFGLPPGRLQRLCQQPVRR
jgi:AraC-like DNA-binding protein